MNNKKIKEKEHKLTITWNRVDGSERARFNNFDDALIFAEATKNEVGQRCTITRK